MKYDDKGNAVYSLSEIHGRISDFGGTIGFPCSITLIYGIVRLLRGALTDWQGWVLTIGALLSFFGVVFFGITIMEEKKKSWRSFIFSLAGFFPYMLGSFLVFYKGFYSFTYLLTSFSFLRLVAPIIWIVLGYRMVSQLHLMTEFGRAISEGRIKVER